MNIGEPYLRKKGNKYIIEVKSDAKTIFLKTLPDIHTLITLVTGKASNEYIENKVKESLKASQLDGRLEEVQESKDADGPEGRLMKIRRTFENDALGEDSETEEEFEPVELTEEEERKKQEAINKIMKDILT